MSELKAFNTLSDLLKLILLSLATILVVVFIYVSFKRLVFPYEIRWMEGGMLDHVLHIRNGNTLYGEPTWEFTPLIYMPLYHYVSALVSYITGPNFMSLRLVSILSTYVAALLAGKIILKETGSQFAAIMAGLFLIAAYKISGFFLDLGRVDSLFIALLLGYYYTARNMNTAGGQILAAFIATLAFFTKQATVLYAAPIVIYLFFTQPKSLRFITPVTGILLTLTGLAYLHLSTDGWFWYYAFELPLAHQYQWYKLPSILKDSLLLQIPFLLVLAAIAAICANKDERHKSVFTLIIVVTVTGATLLHYMHTGSAANVLLPLHASGALLLGYSLAILDKKAWLACVGSLLAILQFSQYFYWPGEVLPAQSQIERNQLTEACFERIPGPILSTRIGYVSSKLGLTPTATEPAIADVFRTADNETNTALLNEFRKRVDEQYYTAAFLGIQLQVALKDELEKNYVYVGENFGRQEEAGAYQLSSVWLAKRFVANKTITSTPVCEADSFFVDAPAPVSYTMR